MPPLAGRNPALLTGALPVSELFAVESMVTVEF